MGGKKKLEETTRSVSLLSVSQVIITQLPLYRLFYVQLWWQAGKYTLTYNTQKRIQPWTEEAIEISHGNASYK